MNSERPKPQKLEDALYSSRLWGSGSRPHVDELLDQGLSKSKESAQPEKTPAQTFASDDAPPASPLRSRGRAVNAEDLSTLGRVVSPGDSPLGPVRCSSRLKALVTPQKSAPPEASLATAGAKLRSDPVTPQSMEKTARPVRAAVVAAAAARESLVPMKRPAGAALLSVAPVSAARAAKAKLKTKAVGNAKALATASRKKKEAHVSPKLRAGGKAGDVRKRPGTQADVRSQPPSKKVPRLQPQEGECEEKTHTPLMGRIMRNRESQALTQVPIDSIRFPKLDGSSGVVESDTDGVRARPRRNRLQPLQAWRSEKIIYGIGREAVAVQLDRAPRGDGKDADVKRQSLLMHSSAPETGESEGLSTNVLRTYTVCLPAFQPSRKASKPQMVALAGTGQDAQARKTSDAHGVLYVEEGRVRCCVHRTVPGTKKTTLAGDVVLEKGDAAVFSCRHRVLVSVDANPDAPSARVRWVCVANKFRATTTASAAARV
eukprot:TRINITY_DN20905_c0_g1_i1.p1 TRINITY_DN20905_c0_g1~~TRINITY_DN20905_c0_g1_i1.p1  ORF type:complete len:488 (+),score=77.30 TRINITY_DN20905_c0_g1_i1:64-1527(+)